MGKVKGCMVCGKKVQWEKVVEEFDGIFTQVDTYGEDSLGESEQYVYNGNVCSSGCYENML